MTDTQGSRYIAADDAGEAARLYSVTTLIDAGAPKGEALIGWAAKTVAEAALVQHRAVGAFLEDGLRDEALDSLKNARYRSKRKALARGSHVHAIAEKIALGVPVDVPDDVAPYVEQYRRFLADHAPRFLMAEAPVYNLSYHYAGTLDTIVELDGLTLLVDVKTNDKTVDDEGARPPYKEIALQLVAYARAEVVGIGAATQRNYNGRRYYIYDPAATYVDMPKVDGALALVVFPDDYSLTPVRVDDEVFDAFLHVREVARWTLSTAGTVLGPPITAPTVPELDPNEARADDLAADAGVDPEDAERELALAVEGGVEP